MDYTIMRFEDGAVGIVHDTTGCGLVFPSQAVLDGVLETLKQLPRIVRKTQQS